MRLACAAWTLVLGVAFVPVPCVAGPTDGLDAYRALARSPGRTTVGAFTREAITAALRRDTTTPADSSADLVLDWPGPPCGVYVSLARGRATRACVGTLTPLGGTLGATLRELARQVVSADPRHPPVRAEELDSLALVVAFAAPPEPVADPMLVAPSREGLLVTSSGGSIAFLPGEARSVGWALSEARRAGVLERASEATFQRFAVVTIRQPAPIEEATHAAR